MTQIVSFSPKAKLLAFTLQKVEKESSVLWQFQLDFIRSVEIREIGIGPLELRFDSKRLDIKLIAYF